jgi:hypothetical protein
MGITIAITLLGSIASFVFVVRRLRRMDDNEALRVRQFSGKRALPLFATLALVNTAGATLILTAIGHAFGTSVAVGAMLGAASATTLWATLRVGLAR